MLRCIEQLSRPKTHLDPNHRVSPEVLVKFTYHKLGKPFVPAVPGNDVSLSFAEIFLEDIVRQRPLDKGDAWLSLATVTD